MNYLLSVIIPTRNRFSYCLSSIESCIDLAPNVQVVVQDNSDTSNKEIIENKYGSKKNLKYNYHPGVLSFVDNFSEAVELSDGKYICVIGDDDAILPNILSVINMMEEKKADAVIPGLNSVYFWPTNEPIEKRGENGLLYLTYIRNKTKRIDPLKGLDKLISRAGQGYQEYGIPRVYHGVIKKECFDEIKNKTGHYFGGLTPDIYSAVSLCYACKNVYSVEYPITVSGICPTSGSAASATGKHTGELSSAPHFKGHSNYVWDEKAPAIYSVESIWAETVLQALKENGDERRYAKFNSYLLDAICYKKYKQRLLSKQNRD